jgi:26S proteasome regulatory subunit N2
MQVQDDKLDVEMKSDETSPKDGDVSPITQSVLNLGDESKASSSRSRRGQESSQSQHTKFDLISLE